MAIMGVVDRFRLNVKVMFAGSQNMKKNVLYVPECERFRKEN